MPDDLDLDGGEAVEETAPEAAPEPVAEAAPAPWSPPQEEWQQVTSVVGQLAELLNQEQPQPDPMAEVEWDPFDPESMQRAMQIQARQIAEEMMAPFQGLLGMLSEREGESLAKAELAKIQSEVGEFDNDMAYLLASGIVDQGGDPAQALRHAGTTVHDFESRIRADERAKVQAELQGLGSAPSETGVGSGEAVPNQEVPTGPGRYDEVIARWRANRNPNLPVG